MYMMPEDTAFETLLCQAVRQAHQLELQNIPPEEELAKEADFSADFQRRMKRILNPSPRWFPRGTRKFLLIAAVLMALAVSAAAAADLPGLLRSLFAEQAPLAEPYTTPLAQAAHPRDAKGETLAITVQAATVDDSLLYILYEAARNDGGVLTGELDFDANLSFDIPAPQNGGFINRQLPDGRPDDGKALFALCADFDEAHAGTRATLTLRNLRRWQQIDLQKVPLNIAELAAKPFNPQQGLQVDKYTEDFFYSVWSRRPGISEEELKELVARSLSEQALLPEYQIPAEGMSITLGEDYPGVRIVNAGFVDGFFEVIVQRGAEADPPDFYLRDKHSGEPVQWPAEEPGKAVYAVGKKAEDGLLCYYWDTRGHDTADLALEYGGEYGWVTIIPGTWSASFTIEQVKTAEKVAFQQAVKLENIGFSVLGYSFSPFSFSIWTDAPVSELHKMAFYTEQEDVPEAAAGEIPIYVRRKNGGAVQMAQSPRIIETDEGSVLKLPFETPQDPAEIASLLIGDTVVWERAEKVGGI